MTETWSSSSVIRRLSSVIWPKRTTMAEAKPLLQSKTFGGAVVVLGGAALTLGHYTLTPADAAQAVDLLSGIAGAVGGLIAICGRVVATQKIGA